MKLTNVYSSDLSMDKNNNKYAKAWIPKYGIHYNVFQKMNEGFDIWAHMEIL